MEILLTESQMHNYQRKAVEHILTKKKCALWLDMWYNIHVRIQKERQWLLKNLTSYLFMMALSY